MAIDKLPGDAMMLLSFVNTRLRDDGITLEDLAVQFGTDKKEIEEKLDKIGYIYDNELNRFV